MAKYPKKIKPSQQTHSQRQIMLPQMSEVCLYIYIYRHIYHQ